MKLAAVATSHVMESLGLLPGVATLDWCDRAAAAISRVHHPLWVGACLARLDQRGALSHLEATGAAASTGPALDPVGTPGLPTKVIDLGRLRQSYREGDWLGWSPAAMQDGAWFVGSAAQAGLLARKGDNPLSRRWAELDPAEVLLAAVAVPATAGRMMVFEIASHDPALRESARAGAVLAATLPVLQKRVLSALGSAPTDKATWLTPREELVLWNLVAGRSVPEIAEALHRSVYTVHDHVKALHRKLGASNRGQLVARALGHLGPLTLGDSAPVASTIEATGEPLKAKSVIGKAASRPAHG